MLNIAEILKDCPKGTTLYSIISGEVKLVRVDIGQVYSIVVSVDDNDEISYTAYGRLYDQHKNGECLLFPSKDQRDWTKFKVKKERFDPHTLKPFDRVLIQYVDEWQIDFFSHFKDEENNCATCSVSHADVVIPYNDDTKHLIGTTDDCPEYYKWWEK